MGLDGSATSADLICNSYLPLQLQHLMTSSNDAVRLRSELQAELQKTDIKTETGHQRARQQIEGSLVQEMESHTCPVCYELMVPPRNAPILLFPCGTSVLSELAVLHNSRIA